MVQTTACPPAQQWQELAEGRLSEKLAQELEDHLATCATCLATVRSLSAEDSLTATLRARPTAQEASETLDGLMRRLKGMRAGVVAEETVTTAADGNHPSADATTPTYDFLSPAQGPGELGRLGGYRVLRLLGAGGMGMVFEAEDTALNRPVALKVMRPDLAAREQSRQRFTREAQATAKLDHDHIVHIYQVGEDRGVPFLAMQFLKGQTLDERLRTERILPVAEALRIGREIAEGLAAAHAAGLIHRDIKPANVWLEGERGRVKLLDFGLARATADAGVNLTQSGTVAGTPSFMAPEQAYGENVDGRCDLFALGCVLYRALTGVLPFQGPTTMAVLLALAQDEPRPLHELNPAVPAALADLVMQLLRKSPADRPESARAVVQAIEALERAQTVPVPAPRPKRSWWLRAALIVGAAAAIVVAAFLFSSSATLRTKDGTLTVTVQEPGVKIFVDGEEKIVLDSKTFGQITLRPGKHSMTVQRGDKVLDTKEFTLEAGGTPTIHATWTPLKDGVVTVFTAEPGVKVYIDGKEKLTVDKTKEGKVELPAGTYRLTVKRGDEELYREAFALENGGKVKIDATWPLPVPGILGTLTPAKIPVEDRFEWQNKIPLVAVLGDHRLRHWHSVSSVAYSTDGTALVTAGTGGEVNLWDAKTFRRLASIPTQATGTPRVAWLPGKRILAVGRNTDQNVRLFDLAGDEPKLTATLPGHVNGIATLAFSPDGIVLACSYRDGVRLWNLSGEKPKEMPPLKGYQSAIAFAPAIPQAPGKKVLAALGDDGKTVTLWDVGGPEYQRVREIKPTVASVACLAFSPDGKKLVVARAAFVAPWAEVWDLEAGEEAKPVPFQAPATEAANVNAVAWGPAGKLAFATNYGVALWDMAGPPKRVGPLLRLGRGPANLSVAFSPDGRELSTGLVEGCVRIWDLTGSQPREKATQSGNVGEIRSLAFSADDRTLVVASSDDLARFWKIDGDKFVEGRVLSRQAMQYGVVLAPDLKTLAFQGYAATPGSLMLTENEQLREWLALPRGPAAFAAGILFAGEAATVRRWDLSGATLKSLPPVEKNKDGTHVTLLAVSPNGKWLATNGDKMVDGKPKPDLGYTRLWNLAGGPTPTLLETPSGRVPSQFAFSADSRILAVKEFSAPNLVVYDLSKPTPVRRATFTVPLHFKDMAYAPVGTRFAASTSDQKVLVWDGDLTRPPRIFDFPGLIRKIAWAHDGRHLAVGAQNGLVYVLRCHRGGDLGYSNDEL